MGGAGAEEEVDHGVGAVEEARAGEIEEEAAAATLPPELFRSEEVGLLREVEEGEEGGWGEGGEMGPIGGLGVHVEDGLAGGGGSGGDEGGGEAGAGDDEVEGGGVYGGVLRGGVHRLGIPKFFDRSRGWGSPRRTAVEEVAGRLGRW